jgi:peroxiredoxin
MKNFFGLVAAAWLLTSAQPAVAQADFKPVPSRALVAARLSDAEVNELVTTLDRLLAHQTDPAKWGTDAIEPMRLFLFHLQYGNVSPTQEQRVLQDFDGLTKTHPADMAFIERQRQSIRMLLVGKVAPDIVGKDYDGVQFKLSDYRGKVILLVFSEASCSPCQSEYPYQRFLADLYKDKPFTVPSVNSDRKLEDARKERAAYDLKYRSWWDGYAQDFSAAGPIATAWNVPGWPSIYLLDETGTIRFVFLREADVLKGVKQLMTELEAKTAKK